MVRRAGPHGSRVARCRWHHSSMHRAMPASDKWCACILILPPSVPCPHLPNSSFTLENSMRAKTTAPAAGWPRCVAAYVLDASRKSATTWCGRVSGRGQRLAAEHGANSNHAACS